MLECKCYQHVSCLNNSNYIKLKFFLVKCQPGEFNNDETGGCDKCPANTFQSEAMKSFCLPCPDGMMTLTDGAKLKTECKLSVY